MLRTGVTLQCCLALTACDRLPFLVSAEESATRACEERLKGDLTSPSSYTRVWSSFKPAGPVTKEEEIEKFETDRLRALRAGDDATAISSFYIENCLKHPSKECGMLNVEDSPAQKTAFVLIEYEAANAFNAKLPGYFTCRMTVREDDIYEQANVFTSGPVSKLQGDRLKSLNENIHRS